MKQKITKNEEIMDLDNNPFLKKLLINFCAIHYEQDAIYDDEHLLKEYYHLIKNNIVEELFNCEKLSNMYTSSKLE